MSHTTRGVYVIRNLKTNRVYIGSSDHVDRRLAQHRGQLNNGTHPISNLQIDWDIGGPEMFCCEILQEVRRGNFNVLEVAEQRCIDQLLSEGVLLYNRTTRVANAERVRRWAA